MGVERLQQKLPELITWIDHTLSVHRPTARPVAALGFKRLPAYYPADLLAAAQAIPVARCPVPPLAQIGLAGFDEFERLPAAGITYYTTFFVRYGHEHDESLHFHELVHVIQWQHLGPERFIMTYALGHLRSGYRHNPLEEMAYDLQARFDHGEAGFDAAAHVRAECDRAADLLLKPASPK